MYQLLKATKYLHSGNVIHRDQKVSCALNWHLAGREAWYLLRLRSSRVIDHWATENVSVWFPLQIAFYMGGLQTLRTTRPSGLMHCCPSASGFRLPCPGGWTGGGWQSCSPVSSASPEAFNIRFFRAYPSSTRCRVSLVSIYEIIFTVKISAVQWCLVEADTPGYPWIL